LYNEKCGKCGKERPEFFVQINKTATASGGVVVETQFGVWNVLEENQSKVVNN
jgi:hypothetical protein